MAAAALALLLLALPGCLSLPYDLSEVPVPISAKPSGLPADQVTPLHIEVKNRLFFHGAFGRTPPDVAALVTEAAAGYDRIANFKVTQSGSFHSWFLAHISLTLYRLRTVTIEGELIKD